MTHPFFSPTGGKKGQDGGRRYSAPFAFFTDPTALRDLPRQSHPGLGQGRLSGRR